LHYANVIMILGNGVINSDNDLKLKVLRHLKKLQNEKKTHKMAKDIFNYIVRLWPESSFDCWGQDVYWDVRRYDKKYDLDAVIHFLECRKNDN
jgi:hypothetical protein